jgi:DNA-binding transcriptional regulator GbsR (MarR family)
MNKKRRDEVRQTYAALQKVISDLKEINDDEQYAYDAIPENLQDTPKALESEECIDNLDSAIDSCQEALEYLDEIV